MKKLVFGLLMLSVLLVLIVAPAFAQDAPIELLVKENGFLPWIKANWSSVLFVLTAVYEIVASVFPTIKDWSLLSNIYRLLRKFLPNNNTLGGTHKV